MSSLLQKLLGFATSDITLLTDAQATKTNIIENLKSVVAGAKAGKFSYLVFSMSSHGTQVPDGVGIPAKLNTSSGGKPNGIPG